MPNKKDWQIANEQNWYRIPKEKAPTIIKENRAKFIAFYFPVAFGQNMKWRVSHYAKIKLVTQVSRNELFPNEPLNEKSQNIYYKVSFEVIEILPQPFISKRGHRILFLSTTEENFFSGSTNFNLLFQNSFLEDKMEKLMDAMKIEYEREWREYVDVKKFYYLDFAIWCVEGKINVECDGDEFHMKHDNVHLDKTRNNELESYGWTVLRFTSKHFNEEKKHIEKSIYQSIKSLGGSLRVSEPEPFIPKKLDDNQMNLFDI